MFDHYVMFRLKIDKKPELPTFVAKLKQLERDVPVIRFSEVLLNGIEGRKSYDLMFHCRFDSEEGYHAYMSHPKHIPVMRYVEGICNGIADVDVVGT